MISTRSSKFKCNALPFSQLSWWCSQISILANRKFCPAKDLRSREGWGNYAIALYGVFILNADFETLSTFRMKSTKYQKILGSICITGSRNIHLLEVLKVSKLSEFINAIVWHNRRPSKSMLVPICTVLLRLALFSSKIRRDMHMHDRR